SSPSFFSFVFFFTLPPPTEIYTLSLHDALPILAIPENIPLIPRPAARSYLVDLLFEHEFCSSRVEGQQLIHLRCGQIRRRANPRSEEHTSELQSPCNLVCRLLLEKKKKKQNNIE